MQGWFSSTAFICSQQLSGSAGRRAQEALVAHVDHARAGVATAGAVCRPIPHCRDWQPWWHLLPQWKSVCPTGPLSVTHQPMQSQFGLNGHANWCHDNVDGLAQPQHSRRKPIFVADLVFQFETSGSVYGWQNRVFFVCMCCQVCNFCFRNCALRLQLACVTPCVLGDCTVWRCSCINWEQIPHASMQCTVVPPAGDNSPNWGQLM